MKIITVEYRQLRTFGGYNNETVGAVAEVVDGQTPEELLAELKAWVDSMLGDHVERANLREAVSELRYQKEQLERHVSRAEQKWEAIIAFMQKLVIERPADIPDSLEGLPF